jgi:hypothetical protein
MIAEASPAALEFLRGTGQQNKIATIWGKRKWLLQSQHRENGGRVTPHGVWAMSLLIMTPIKDWKPE